MTNPVQSPRKPDRPCQPDYKVEWSAVSSDTHPITGKLQVRVLARMLTGI
ncbi:copper resistance protein CopC [Pseudomonas sp. UMAB-08]